MSTSPTINDAAAKAPRLTGVDRIVEQLHRSSANAKGDAFEMQVVPWILRNAPEFRNLARVWTWKQWPGRPYDNESGIDIVAETTDGELWAIQAKAYSENHYVTKADIDSFLSESSKHFKVGGEQVTFTHRLLIATTDRIGPTARRTMDGQVVPVSFTGLTDLRGLNVSWPTRLADMAAGKAGKVRKLTPRPHQRQAIASVVHGLKHCTRAQMVMACGTGKTLTSLWIDEALGSTRTAVLAPSLSLVRQTLWEWRAQASEPFAALAVCSDEKVGSASDEMHAHLSDLGVPVTTDPQVVAAFLARPGRRILFGTYHSSAVIAKAQLLGAPALDMTFADEAHRLAGRIDAAYSTVLEPAAIRSKLRLFMTATPRVLSDRLKEAGGQQIASMDDEDLFGPVLYELSFGEAVSRGLLCDYEIVVSCVTESQVQDLIDTGALVCSEPGGKVTDMRSLARRLALARAMQSFGLRRVIAFHTTVARATVTADDLPGLAELIGDVPVSAHVVSGHMNTEERARLLQGLADTPDGERCTLTNARCLQEGIDVPAVDGVAFLDPRGSVVDVAQAVGRVMRISKGKASGVVLVPVVVPDGADDNEVLSDSAFAIVWKVVSALRAHDQALAEAIDEYRRDLGRRGRLATRLPKITIDLPSDIPAAFEDSLWIRMVQETSSMWDHRYGEVLAYVDEHGPAALMRNIPDPLGSWIKHQRYARRKGLLAVQRTELLEQVDGWVWNVAEAAWGKSYELLREFAVEHGHARPRLIDTYRGARIGTWVGNQRMRRETLSADQRRKLENLPGWTWFAVGWDEGYAQLQRWVAEHGHATVKTPVVQDGYRLGQWVSRQRTERTNGTLSPERAELLSALPGWAWNSHDARWEQRWRAVAQWAAEHGHAVVPQTEKFDGQPIGSWVGTQRVDYRAGRMSRERQQRLESLPGWAWDARATGEARLIADRLSGRKTNPARRRGAPVRSKRKQSTGRRLAAT